MTEIIEDLDLAREMIRLLGNELRSLRSQLREPRQRSSLAENATEAENTELKARIDEMYQEITRLKAEQGEQKPSVHLENLLEETRQELSNISAERDTLMLQKEESNSNFLKKLDKARARCKAWKNSSMEWQEAYNRLKLKTEEEAEHNKALEEALKNENVLQEFDVQAFLETPLPGSPPHAPCPGSILPFCDSSTLIRPKGIRACTFLSSLSAVRYELHWSNDEAATCIVIVPTHRYNAKLYDGYGAWESVSSQEPGETRDLFWRNGGWCYLGEYECTQVKSISIQQVKNMGSSIENSLYKRTILFPDLVPVFFQNMVEGMYSAGVLRVNCVALKYVGFNAKLDNFLGHIQGNHISIAIPGEKKRKTAPDVDDGRRQKSW